MTSPAATANITWASTDYTDFTGIFLHQIVRGGPGELTSVAGTDDEIPGAEGVFVRNRIGRTRTIEVRGWVRGVATTEASDRDDYWNNREALEAAFDPRDTGTLGADTGSNSYTIVARPISVDFNERTPSFAEVSIVLQSTVPDWTAGGS